MFRRTALIAAIFHLLRPFLNATARAHCRIKKLKTTRRDEKKAMKIDNQSKKIELCSLPLRRLAFIEEGDKKKSRSVTGVRARVIQPRFNTVRRLDTTRHQAPTYSLKKSPPAVVA
ncbi:hypothetical protein KCP76_09380 [Salmonella enterica subsp. enterica serovar Weltevreden]|nr:hypothetical protein KCP76_09380 [Salmonella enterica subsp. enterica serovar Weltevreden]